jgi:Holliday junction resolvasome RuvABC endonuclease subunit
MRISAADAERLGLSGGPKGRRKGAGRAAPQVDLPEIRPGWRIACLDISSSAAGWAILRAVGAGEVERFGVVRPPSRWHPIGRIDAIVAGLEAELAGSCCDLCAMEWQSHKFAARQVHAQGLAVLGQAQGAVYEAMRRMGFMQPVACVGERAWTLGRPKARRAQAVRLRCPEYARWADAGQDAGLDACDSIGLGFFLIDRASMRGG